MDYDKWIELINNYYIIYACVLFVTYIVTAIISYAEIRSYINKNRYVDYMKMLSFNKLPSISIIAPAYNEERTIIENIKCLLSLQYQNFEIIVVNDGSKDNTLQLVIDCFDLISVERIFDIELSTMPVRAIYKSINPAYSHLIIVDKENGGKADALNVGINVAQNDLFLSMDVDCIIEQDALLRMVKPFLDDSKHVVIATGGVIRIANSCEVSDGKIVKVNFPREFWVKFQVLEYFRAFSMGRMAWSKFNGLLIISGAFGLFDRKRVIKVGGYDNTTVGEDLELVVRMRRYMHEVEKQKYRVAFIPDPLCWTEVPQTYNVLSRQRNRWTRGGIDTIFKHRKMFLNPRYGLIGMFSFPYWVFFEWLAPIIEFVGLFYFLIMLIFGLINPYVFTILFLLVFVFSLMYSFFAIFLETYTFNKYSDAKSSFQMILFTFVEMLIYQPLNMYFAITGNLDFFFKKNKRGWGDMTRAGFTNTNKSNSNTK